MELSVSRASMSVTRVRSSHLIVTPRAEAGRARLGRKLGE